MRKLLTLTFAVVLFVSWTSIISTKEFAEKYTEALVAHDTTALKQFIQPANYIPFYAKRFDEAKVLETKDINDTLSSFVFQSNKGPIHTPVLKKDGQMWAMLNMKNPDDKWSYTIGIYTVDDSKLIKTNISYDMVRWGLSAPSLKEVNKERSSYNTSISSVESISNLKIENKLKTEIRVEITKSRWDGKDFVDKQEKEIKIAPGKKLKLKSIF